MRIFPNAPHNLPPQPLPKQLLRFAEKRYMFHGTSPGHLRAILTKGLDPFPKTRAWQEDEEVSWHRPSRRSYGGVYLTANLMTAISSATFAGAISDKPTGEESADYQRISLGHQDRLIVIVRVETATLLPDEDNFQCPIDWAVNRTIEGITLNEYYSVVLWADIQAGKADLFSKKYLDDTLQYIAEKDNLPPSQIPKFIEHGRQALVDCLKAGVERKAAIAMENAGSYRYRYEEEIKHAGIDLDALPSAAEAEEGFREAMDKLTRKLRLTTRNPGEQFSFNARSMEPITYRGANRIVCVIEMGPRPDIEDPQPLIVYYSSDPEALAAFLQQYETRIGSNYQIIRR